MMLSDIDLTLVVLIVVEVLVLGAAFVAYNRWHIKPIMKQRMDAIDAALDFERLNRDN